MLWTNCRIDAEDKIWLDPMWAFAIFTPFGYFPISVKHIIQQHSGIIWVESQLGHGPTFNFTLPKA